MRIPKESKVFVSGADGFIGSHLVEKLLDSGYKVRAFSLYNSFNTYGWLDSLTPDYQSQIQVVTGDIRDSNGVREAVKGCDAVIHLASLIAIPFSYNSPQTYVETNILGTLNLLQAAKEFTVRKFIHTSTSEVYGTAQFVPISENHPLQGQSPYSASKIGADQLVYSFSKSFGLPCVIVRPFNTYGPRQSARAVIPTVITQIANGSKIIKLGSTEPTRDFSYVLDTAQGFIAALESDHEDGEVFNLGSNFEISILDTVQLISSLMHTEIKIENENKRMRPQNSEVERLWADNSRAIKELSWNPKYTGKEGFIKGLKETIEWFMDPDNLKRYKYGIYNI